MNQQDYGERFYNPRVGRFLSYDPIAKDYPELTPYQFACNTPIAMIDLDGLEAARPGRSRPGNRRGSLREEAESRGLRVDQSLRRIKEGRRINDESVPVPNSNGRRLGLPLEQVRQRRVLRSLRYLNQVFENAQSVFGQYSFQQINFRINKENGRIFEGVLKQELLKNPNNLVVSQVTLEIAGKVNGEAVKVRIRIDDLTRDRNTGTVDLHEAIFSIIQINGNNHNRTLTGNQQTAFTILTKGTEINIFIAGEKALLAGYSPGQNITADVPNVTVVANNVQSGQPQTVATVPVSQQQPQTERKIPILLNNTKQ